MMEMLTHQAPLEMKKIGVTIRTWFFPIIRMWHFVQNNGITEGFHRKMKLIQRRAYGYRNFENYRLRVLLNAEGLIYEIISKIPLPTDFGVDPKYVEKEKALKRSCFKAFIWWSIAGSNR